MGTKAKILYVEDREMDVVLALDAFKQFDLNNHIHVVRNGQEALDYLFGEGEYADKSSSPLPDLILLDLKLPGISGHEVLRKIKTTQSLWHIPVVILSSSKEEGDLALSYSSGANSYLVKPIRFEGFIEIVGLISEYWLSLNIEAPKNE